MPRKEKLIAIKNANTVYRLQQTNPQKGIFSEEG